MYSYFFNRPLQKTRALKYLTKKEKLFAKLCNYIDYSNKFYIFRYNNNIQLFFC